MIRSSDPASEAPRAGRANASTGSIRSQSNGATHLVLSGECLLTEIRFAMSCETGTDHAGLASTTSKRSRGVRLNALASRLANTSMGNRLASASGDYTVRVWNALPRKPREPLSAGSPGREGAGPAHRQGCRTRRLCDKNAANCEPLGKSGAQPVPSVALAASSWPRGLTRRASRRGLTGRA
jgi:hypothetical protein